MMAARSVPAADWREALPAVVDMENFISTPSLARMPLAPTRQPAASSMAAASVGLLV